MKTDGEAYEPTLIYLYMGICIYITSLIFAIFSICFLQFHKAKEDQLLTIFLITISILKENYTSEMVIILIGNY